MFCKNMVVPKPLKVQITMQDKLDRIKDDTPTLFLNPLAIMQSIYDFHIDKFRSMFATNLPGFWNSVSDTDPRWTAMGWIKDMSLWQQRAIPIVIHGDGATFTEKNSNSLLAVQIKSLCSSGTFGLDILPLFAIPKTVRHIHEGVDATTPKLWQYMVHFINAGQEGKHPMTDPDGNEWPLATAEKQRAGHGFCDEHFLVPWVLTGDLEFLGNELKMPHFNSNEPCWQCAANRYRDTATPVTDFHPQASWTDTLFFQAAIAIQGLLTTRCSISEA